MKKYIVNALLAIVLISSTAFVCNEKTIENYQGNDFVIVTSLGDIKIKLYDETPKHRDNFRALVNKSFYDSTLFHRVIEGFMIQGGDPESKGAESGIQLGGGGPGYTLEAEFNPKFIHKKGALAAARQGDQVNPQKRSSGSQFYIVQGRTFNDNEINQMEAQKNMSIRQGLAQQAMQDPNNRDIVTKGNKFYQEKNQDSLMVYQKKLDAIVTKKFIEDSLSFTFTEEQKKIYKSIGGAPNLDGDYTIFGEVVEGLDVIDKIAAVAKDQNNRPETDIMMMIKPYIKED